MKKEIYFVDDNADQRFIVKNIFQHSLTDYTLRLFDSGQALYLHLIKISADGYSGPMPGLFLLDLNMPGIDGYSLLKLIRQRFNAEVNSWTILPVVIFTSYATQDQLYDCYQAGANSVMIKPSLPDGLTSQLELICNYWLGHNKQVV
jgi:CheY-like chemotaxis protein